MNYDELCAITSSSVLTPVMAKKLWEDLQLSFGNNISHCFPYYCIPVTIN